MVNITDTINSELKAKLIKIFQTNDRIGLKTPKDQDSGIGWALVRYKYQDYWMGFPWHCEEGVTDYKNPEIFKLVNITDYEKIQ